MSYQVSLTALLPSDCRSPAGNPRPEKVLKGGGPAATAGTVGGKALASALSPAGAAPASAVTVQEQPRRAAGGQQGWRPQQA